ncbi:MAG: hypothetical protein A4E30_01089 [Methanomassiliicoccales archaeon PtaB.Bin215]|nr:MAG: hypothetical protein A4E30_01089 [Methanomassiliicoccales archaeon PtaB.Bin215]
MRGLARLRRGDEGHPFTIDVQGRPVHRVDLVLVLQYIPGQRQCHALDPPVVIEVEQEGGLSIGLEKHLQGTVRVLQADDAAVGAHRLGHGIEIILPHVLDRAAQGVQLDAAAADVRLGGVKGIRGVLLVKEVLLIVGDQPDRVAHEPWKALLAIQGNAMTVRAGPHQLVLDAVGERHQRRLYDIARNAYRRPGLVAVGGGY